jgi:hypothetical protein
MPPDEINSLANESGQKKPRRWGRRVLVVGLALIILLIFMAPYLLSTGAGTSVLLSVINDPSRDKVEIADLSLSWFGPCHVSGVKVWDQKDREVFQLEKVDLELGVWGALLSWENFKDIQIKAPEATVYMDRSEEPSDKKDSKEKPSEQSSLPSPQGQIVVERGLVRLVQSDGRIFEIKNINSQLKLDTLSQIKGSLQFQVTGGGQVNGEVQFDNLVSAGQLQLETAKGSLDLKSEGEINLAPLLEFLQPDGRTGGNLNLNITMRCDGKNVAADFTTSVRGLHVGIEGARDIQPIDLELTGQLKGDPKEIRGSGKLAGQPGGIDISFSMQHGGNPVTFEMSDLASALLTGSPLVLPDFSFQSTGELDLPALAAAIPALLKIQPDVQVTQGQLNIQNLTLAGGANPQLQGLFELVELTAVKDSRTVAIEPIRADFDLALEPGSGLKIEEAKVDSPYLQLTTRGNASRLDGTFQANLNLLQEQLSPLFDLGPTQVAGRLNGTYALNRKTQEQIDTVISLNAEQLRYNDGTKDMQFSTLGLGYEGELTFKDQSLSGLQVRQSNIDLDGRLAAGARGRYDFENQTFECELNLSQISLAYLQEQFGLKTEARTNKVGGSLSGNIGATGNLTDIALARGDLKVKDFSLNGRRIAEKDSTVGWQNVRIDTLSQRIEIGKIALGSEALSAELSGTVTEYASACRLDLEGWYEGHWEKIMPLVHQFAPETAETINLVGKAGRDIRVTGPLKQPEVVPTYSGIAGSFGVGWDSAEVYGLKLDKAALAPKLADGKLTLGDKPIPAGAGNIQLKGLSVDLQDDEPILRFEGKNDILDKVPLNAEVGRQLLSHINPIFTKLAGMEGEVSLSMDNISLPLGEGIKKRGSGQMVLDLSKMKLWPQGFLAELLGSDENKKDEMQSVKISPVHLQFKQGRIYYDNFDLLFADGFELSFSGYVSFDDNLNLNVALPISESLLSKFGVGGSAAEYARMLQGTKVDIPMGGTRLKPRLDLEKVDLKPLLKKATDQLIEDKAKQALEDLLGGKRKRSKNQSTEGDPKSNGQKNLEEDLVDIFFEAIKDKDEK